MRVRSMVGLIPLFAVDTIEPQVIERLAGIPAPHGMVRAATGRTCAATSRRFPGKAWNRGGC